MNTKYDIGIIGGTGDAGCGLAVRLAKAGHVVTIGSREEQKAKQVENNIIANYNGLKTRGATNQEAATCPIVIVATPWDSTIATLRPLKDELKDKTVVSMVNSVIMENKEMHSVIPASGSMAFEIANLLKSDTVTGAFHHLPAKQLLKLETQLDQDVVVFGDNDQAVEQTLELTNSIKNLKGVYVGSIKLSFAVEAFTSVLVSASIRHKGHASIKLTGIKPK